MGDAPETPPVETKAPTKRVHVDGPDPAMDAFDSLLKQFEGTIDTSVMLPGIVDPFSDHPIELPTETTDDEPEHSDSPDNPDDGCSQ